MPGAISPWETRAPSDVSTTRPEALADDPAVRAVTVIGLIAVGVIHSLEVPGQVSGAVWLTIGFALLAVVAPANSQASSEGRSSSHSPAAGATCALAAAGYVLTRSVPVPGDAADVGNWLEPLGVASLTIEAVVVILALIILTGIYRISYASRPWVRAFSTD